MLDAPRFIGSEIYRRSSYGARHPLAIPRVSTVIDLSRALGWLPDSQYFDSPVASPDELARFHDRDYVAVLASRCKVRLEAFRVLCSFRAREIGWGRHRVILALID